MVVFGALARHFVRLIVARQVRYGSGAVKNRVLPTLVDPKTGVRMPAVVGKISDPYIPPESSAQMAPLFSSEGVSQRWTRLQKTWRASAVLGELKRRLRNFTLEAFKEEARDVYVRTHVELYKGNLNKLRLLVTENVFVDMKREIEQRLAEKQTVHWEMLDPPTCSVLHMNIVRVFNKNNMFAQVTCRFESQQRLMLYDRRGKLLRSGTDERTKEIWVLERYLGGDLDMSAWRFAGKLESPWPQLSPPPLPPA